MEKLNCFSGIFCNWVFGAILTATVVFQIAMVELFGSFANTIPLSSKLWIWSVLIGFIGMPVGILIKFIPVDYEKNDSEDTTGYEALPSGPADV